MDWETPGFSYREGPSSRASESRPGQSARPMSGDERHERTSERAARREGGWGQDSNGGSQDWAGGAMGSQVGGRPNFSQGLPSFGRYVPERHENRGTAQGRTSFAGKGPKGYKRSDERIREDVYERLTSSDVDCEDVQVTVKNGEVTLTGASCDGESRREIERIAESVSGVVDVTNQIRARRDSDRGDDAKKGSSDSLSPEGRRGQQHASPS